MRSQSKISGTSVTKYMNQTLTMFDRGVHARSQDIQEGEDAAWDDGHDEGDPDGRGDSGQWGHHT